MLTSKDIMEMNAKSEDGAKIFILTCTSGIIDEYADVLHKKGFDVDVIRVIGPRTIWYNGCDLEHNSKGIIRLGSLNELIQLLNVVHKDLDNEFFIYPELVLSSGEIPTLEIYNDYRE